VSYEVISGVPLFRPGDEVELKGQKFTGPGHVVSVCDDPSKEPQPLDESWYPDEPFPQVMVRMKKTNKRIRMNGKDLQEKKVILKSKPLTPKHRLRLTADIISDLERACEDSKTMGYCNFDLRDTFERNVFNDLAHRVYFCGVNTHLFIFRDEIYELCETNKPSEFFILYHKPAPKSATVTL
jgi:hypothetical protein